LALVMGCGVALIYALFTGSGYPSPAGTVLMLLTATWLRWYGLRWPWPHLWLPVFCVAGGCPDPWALLQAGFWLSFVAVGVLFASGSPARRCRTDTRSTCLAAITQYGARTVVDECVLWRLWGWCCFIKSLLRGWWPICWLCLGSPCCVDAFEFVGPAPRQVICGHARSSP
jgi:predicted membrane metal-binding protein